MSTPSPAHVIVIGGGISGLAAAWFLVQSDRNISVTVLEGSPVLGGKLAVSDVAGIPVDQGAESFVASRPEALLLAREIGMETELVVPSESSAGVWSRGRTRALPRGQFMGIPTDLRALAASEAISLSGLMRVPLDRVLPPSELPDDISVGALVGGRLGREVVERLVEPLLGGVYAGNADELSTAATMPALLREMRHERSLLAATRRVAGGGMAAAGARRGVPFRGVVGGVGRVPGAIAAALVGHGVQIRTRSMVRRLSPTATGWEVEVGTPENPEVLNAEGVVLAVPPAPGSRLLSEAAPSAAMELADIPTASVAVIALAYKARDLRMPLAGSGLLVPPVEGRTVKAVTYLDRKWGWLGEAAEAAGLRLLRTSVGRHGDTTTLQRSDEELVAIARVDLAHMLGVTGVPVDTRVTRWGGALPQYTVGHRARVDRIHYGLRGSPTLAVCGAALDGVGVAACIGTAHEASGRVVRGLAKRQEVAHG